jgi:(p)ppGpp synthase/HD superfamily hydrolase
LRRHKKRTRLTERFGDAMAYAFLLHRRQKAKGPGVPYMAHLMGATALVLHFGGDEDQAIATLLHDGPEDQGGRPILREIQRRFGSRVAGIVEGCTDTFRRPKPPWKARKVKYLKHLETAPEDTLLVSAADKLYNARAIVSDLRIEGDEVWDRFNKGRRGQLLYYQSLAAVFEKRGLDPMARELSLAVKQMKRLSPGTRV